MCRTLLNCIIYFTYKKIKFSKNLREMICCRLSNSDTSSMDSKCPSNEVTSAFPTNEEFH